MSSRINSEDVNKIQHTKIKKKKVREISRNVLLVLLSGLSPLVYLLLAWLTGGLK